jgi:Kef-type K+ transport system membrane component KefB
VSVTDVLVDILLVLLAAKVAAEVAERLHIPPVVGEIIAGVIIGPSLLDFVEPTNVLTVLGQLGVILLLLDVGLELSLADLASVGRAALLVAVIGVILPMVGGFGVGIAFGESENTAIFLGAALAATSVGITARVFSDLRALTRIEARTVLGAAVADDVLGLMILTIVVRIVTADSVSGGEILKVLVIAVAFLVVAVGVGVRFGPKLFERIDRHARSQGTFVALALAFTLAFAVIADAAELAPIIGAFVAGVALSGSSSSERLRREITPVAHLFVPVFFLSIGVAMDLDALADPDILLLAGGLMAVAVIGKIIAGVGAVGTPSDKLLVGLGMLPRGEVGLIFASIGLSTGVLNSELYGALLLVVLGTTLLAPPLLRMRLLRLQKRHKHRPPAPAPADGWLRVTDEVVLRANPPDEEALVIALEAALLAAQSRPSAGLLDWLGDVDSEQATWDGRATALFLSILRDGNVRSWRFLEAAGILEQALPELADAVGDRRADPFLLDPSHVLRFDLVEAVRDLVRSDPVAADAFKALENPERLMLAALVIAAADEHGNPVLLGRQLSERLQLGRAAEDDVALLVADRGLMRGMAGRIDGLDEEPVVQLAAHLANPENARALYVLSLALGPLASWERQLLDELLSRVLQVQATPQLAGSQATTLVERRREDALRIVGDASDVGDWVRNAPRSYLLTNSPVDIARHATLMEPIPRRDSVRVSTLAVDSGRARIEVVGRDRPGLIAAVSGVLAQRRLDVIGATMATWSNGAALESFLLRVVPGVDLPDEDDLTVAIEAALEASLTAPPEPDLQVSFDDAGSPWYTVCEIRGRDRAGLLHTVTVGFAAAGVSVHSAKVDTRADVAIDRFEVSTVDGGKLSDDQKRAVVAAIHSGVEVNSGSGSRWRLGRRKSGSIVG